ncbi:MAG: methyltransferase domain-containing protein [Nitrospirota bacterium]
MNNSHREKWQLKMFQQSLKKKIKLKHLNLFLEDLNNKICLAITSGDNTGAINYHIYKQGGEWITAELDPENLNTMKDVIDRPILHIMPAHSCFKDNIFDTILILDALEHVIDDIGFLKEMKRILKINGLLIVTVPTGDQRLFINKLRSSLGIKPEFYGHVRYGYTKEELEDILKETGFNIKKRGSYSGAFTELLEFTINYLYSNYISSQKNHRGRNQIIPTAEKELGLAFKIYTVIYPLFYAISYLDNIFFNGGEYAVTVSGIKEG